MLEHSDFPLLYIVLVGVYCNVNMLQLLWF
jgi:hypothetical protein